MCISYSEEKVTFCNTFSKDVAVLFSVLDLELYLVKN